MEKEMINSILQANLHLIKCKLNNESKEQIEIARKKLNEKVASAILFKDRKISHVA
jgi:hypothetical protein